MRQGGQAQHLHLAGHCWCARTITQVSAAPIVRQQLHAKLAAQVRTQTLAECVPQLRQLSTSNLEVPSLNRDEHPTHHQCTPPVRRGKGSVQATPIYHTGLPLTTPSPEEESCTMAGAGPPVRPIYRFMATGLGASMWFWVCQSSVRNGR